MTEQPTWPEPSDVEWQERIRAAESVGRQWAVPPAGPEVDAEAQAWLSSIDPSAYVGARHHTVPRFLLARWADKSGQVRAYHRVEGRHGVENIRDLAVKDFYTVIDIDGSKSSAMESLMGQIEGSAKEHIDTILSPFTRPAPLGADAIMSLAHFAAFQSTRTTRYRRELELHAEWYAKTMATGRVADDELRQVSIAPHQNQAIQLASDSAEKLMPFFLCRPLAVVHLGAPLLYTCDEPVIVNGPGGDFHLEGCFLSDEQIEARIQKKARKMKARRRARAQIPGRTVHFSSVRPTGHGVADEIVLAISPSTALLWGPLAQTPQVRHMERVRLTPTKAARFADMANEAACFQALDWIITRPADEAFTARVFPPTGPLMRVCDGTNAAAAAINEPPDRFRPRRLWTPEE